MAKKTRYKIGDVLAIPVDGNGVAYARIFRDATIGVFDFLSGEILKLEELPTATVLFFAAFFDDAVVDGTWPIVGHQAFASDDAAWPPPRMVRDVINPERFRIYDRGEIRPASPEEVKSLEPVLMYKPNQLVERIRKEKPSTSR